MVKVLGNEYHDEEANARLDAIHRERTSTPQTIAGIIKQGIDKEVGSYDRLIMGEGNEVYIVHPSGGDDVVLRIAHRKTNKFLPEAWAMEQAKKAGVPVAMVYDAGAYQTETGQVYYSLQERLTGKTFDNMLYVEKIDKVRARAITAQAGEILARIHSVSTQGYGDINTEGAGKYPAIDDMVANFTSDREKYQKMFGELGLGSVELDAVFADLAAFPGITETPPHLVHHDYGPKHFFIDDDDQITGVIDFEDVESGDSTIDFGGWNFWFNEEAPLNWLLEGYQQARPLGDNFEDRLRTAQYIRLLELVNYYVNKAPSAKWAKAGAEEIKKILSSK